MEKPREIFDRDVEWDELVRFARLPQGGATLGVVSGRRRQGKTFLLDALVQVGGGFMFTATESTTATDPGIQLIDLGRLYAAN